MQCFIGQICDPIDGYTQIPCFIRNVASVPLAMTCTNYGVLGLDTGVSFDEMAKATLRVGEKIGKTESATAVREQKKKVIKEEIMEELFTFSGMKFFQYTD